MDEVEVAELAEDFEEVVDEKPTEEESENQTNCNEPFLKYQHIEHEMNAIVFDDYVTYFAAHGKVSGVVNSML